MDRQIVLFLANETEFNELAEGRASGRTLSMSNQDLHLQKNNEAIWVIAEEIDDDLGSVKPLAISIPEALQRRIFGKFASLREELAPISSWCHILSNNTFEALDGAYRPANLYGYEAAWTSLAIAETVLLSGRPIESLKVAACYSTLSYAVGRTNALWPRIKLSEIKQKYDAANEISRSSSRLSQETFRIFSPIYSCLIDAQRENSPRNNTVSYAVQVLKNTRLYGGDEIIELSEALSAWPEAKLISDLANMSPELRMHAFDHIVAELENHDDDTPRSEVLRFVGGYLATIAAGGSPSLGLAAKVSAKHPQILAWAYVLGSVGERVTWTSGFSGLGRLVTRELTRALHLDEPPFSDFSIDEAHYIIDKQLSDPLVHLKIKQLRSVSVSLFPGVNIVVPLSDTGDVNISSSQQKFSSDKTDHELARLVESIWPLIKQKIQSEGVLEGRKSRTGSSKKRSSSQSKLV